MSLPIGMDNVNFEVTKMRMLAKKVYSTSIVFSFMVGIVASHLTGCSSRTLTPAERSCILRFSLDYGDLEERIDPSRTLIAVLPGSPRGEEAFFTTRQKISGNIHYGEDSAGIPYFWYSSLVGGKRFSVSLEDCLDWTLFLQIESGLLYRLYIPDVEALQLNSSEEVRFSLEEADLW